MFQQAKRVIPQGAVKEDIQIFITPVDKYFSF